MSDRKFNRAFILKIETGDNEFVEVKSPFTLDFNVVRNNLASANTATFTIYNLGTETRAKIFKDVYDIGNLRAIQLFAGYAESEGDLIPRCFNGTIKRAFSYRQGADFKTVIEAYDGMISMGTDFVSMTVPPSSPVGAAVAKVASELKNVDKVTIGQKFTDLTKRAMSIMGNPGDILKQLTNNNFYIDNQSAYALDQTEVVPGEIRLINYDNGLIGTPKKSELMIEIEMIFEPRIKPSQLIELESLTEDRFNGVYKVTGMTHRGIISGSMGGDCRTVLTMQLQKNTSVVYDQATNEYRVVQE
jgi:hypothetical protein